MHFGRDNDQHEYTLPNGNERIILGKTTIQKDLGVYISNDLKWTSQCSRAAAQANSALGRLKKAFISKDLYLWQ